MEILASTCFAVTCKLPTSSQHRHHWSKPTPRSQQILGHGELQLRREVPARKNPQSQPERSEQLGCLHTARDLCYHFWWVYNMNTRDGCAGFHPKTPRSILRAASSSASTQCGRVRQKFATRFLVPGWRCCVGSCMRHRPDIQKFCLQMPCKQKKKNTKCNCGNMGSS